jgi:chemotaxis response regulator CheB
LEFLAALPVDLPASLLVFLPLPAYYLRILLQRIGDITHFNVHEASNGLRLQKGKAYFAADGYQVGVGARGCLAIDCESSNREEVETYKALFSSAGKYGSSVVYVILGDAEPDRVRGVKDVQAAGGIVFLQELPLQGSQSRLAELATSGKEIRVLPPGRLAKEVVGCVWDNKITGSVH